jgi:hypothetical protein
MRPLFPQWSIAMRRRQSSFYSQVYQGIIFVNRALPRICCDGNRPGQPHGKETGHKGTDLNGPERAALTLDFVPCYGEKLLWV